ncbi:MAG: hypothetical protein LBQ46_00010 [Treponema sp.]|jgi:hypothetical protein|nr:hypothetical protein [Treponema sp.]
MKNLTIIRKGLVYIPVFLAVAIGVFLFKSCLNPITGEYEIPPIPMQGEITVDNINSSELQFVNHTKSMDIVKVEITRFYEESGQSGIKTNLDGRLLGGPHAGTRESLLVRPIGSNQIHTMNVAGYRIKVYYEKADRPEQITSDQLKELDSSNGRSAGNIDIVFGKDEKGVSQTGDWSILPRGKTIVHFYRAKKDGKIGIKISDPSGEADQRDYFDYIQNVIIVDGSGTMNLNNIDVSIRALPAVKVDFSDEVKKSVKDLHLDLENMTKALKDLNQTTASIASLLGTSYKEGRLEIQNYTNVKLAGIGLQSHDGAHTYTIRDISKGQGKYLADVKGFSNPELLNPGKAMSGSVAAGNYYISIVTEDGKSIFGIDTTIHSAASVSGIDNKIYIFQDYIAAAPPVLINWSVTADGGIGNPTDPGYDTTLIGFKFDSDPGDSISFTKTKGKAETGSLSYLNKTFYTMNVTPVVATQEILYFSITAPNVAPGPYGVVIYKHNPAVSPQATTTRYLYKESGVRNKMPLDRHQPHELDWFLSYDEVTYTGGKETGRVTRTLEKFGAFVIDGSNDTQFSDKDSDYVRFNQNGSWANGKSTRTASLRVGEHKSGPYMANDTPPRDKGQWDFYTALDFNTDLSAFGIVIENMPSADVPRYVFGVKLTTTHKRNYLPVTFKIQNK